MTLVALERVTEQQWDELIDGEHEPWGGGVAERFSWREKTHNVGIRAPDGRLLAVAGSVLADIRVAGHQFAALGIGALFVARDARGRGFVASLLDGLLAQADGEDAPGRAMLFCRAQLVGMYGKFGFREIADPVFAQQPAGPVRMPISAMWRPLRAGTSWPTGRVDVLGLPF
ncbi:MAG TPA: GNAT family N-acetyltransferase [Solirubrobacteraceae bacterium]|jgi:predicted GNAT family N-acyltransferase|nr:GNAT family N-acetyltransferase [Solirubrobacteraceae bacterium]